MKTKAWGNLITPLTSDRITEKPREQGLTMVLDRCQALNATSDMLALTGDFVDSIKLSFGTSVFVDELLLRRKIEIIRGRDIDIFPGEIVNALFCHAANSASRVQAERFSPSRDSRSFPQHPGLGGLRSFVGGR